MPSESRFKVGDRVKPSLSALRSKRDHYLDASGSEREKRKGWHDKEAAKRGTVTALNADPRGICSPTLDISWDGGAMSSCLDYTVEHAEPAPTHTDLMVTPESLGAWLDANPQDEEPRP
jgi:hypothetical protein